MNTRNRALVRLTTIICTCVFLASSTQALAAAFSFGTFDAPGASNGGSGVYIYGTSALDINDSGQVSGFFGDGTTYRPFLKMGGSFATLDVPGSYWGTSWHPYGAYSISNNGLVAISSTGGDHQGYVYSISAGTYAPVPSPASARSAYVLGINDAGNVSGFFGNSSGTYSGYTYSSGTLTTFSVPGAANTFAFGINNSGQIAGFYSDGGGVNHGFLYSAGSFITIDVPGARYTQPFGVNDAGQVSGFFGDDLGRTHGFIETRGQFITFDVPGATHTLGFGLNNVGQVTGYYNDISGQHGLVATPVPEPETYAMLLLGLGLLGVMSSRMKHS